MAKKVFISLFLLLFFVGSPGANMQKIRDYSRFDFQHYEEASKKGHWWRVKETTDPFTNESNFLISLPCNRSVEADPYSMEAFTPSGILHIRYEDGDVDLFLYVSTGFYPRTVDDMEGDVRLRLDDGAIQYQKWNMFQSEDPMTRFHLWFFPKENRSLENFVGQLFEHEKIAIEINASSIFTSLNEKCGFNLNGLSKVLQPYLAQIGWSDLKGHSSSDDSDDADGGGVGGSDNNDDDSGGSSSGGCFLNSL